MVFEICGIFIILEIYRIIIKFIGLFLVFVGLKGVKFKEIFSN